MKIYRVFLFFMFFLSGCQFIGFVSPIVTGIIIWKDGRAHKYYELEVDVLFKAVKNTCFDLEFEITSEYKTKNGYYVGAKGRDKFSFYIEKTRSNITDLSLRINTLGNKSYTEMIIHKIDENINLVNYDDYKTSLKLTDLPVNILTEDP